MRAIRMTVAISSFVLSVFIWPFADSMAADTATVPPPTERDYSPIQKQLIELGFPPPGEPLNVNERVSLFGQQVNQGVVRLVSGGVDGIYVRVAADLAAVLGDVENLRILPIIGKGSVQNITDLLYLQGIDLCIVQSDVLSYLTRQNIYDELRQRVHYITKLYSEELHLLARQETQSIQDLSKQNVNFGVYGSETNITASTVFGTLEIEVYPTYFDHTQALEKLKQGEIDGMVYVASKPARLIREITVEEGLHFVPIPATEVLLDTYLTADMTAEDYPGLIPQDSPISTLAVASTLGVYNWETDSARYRNVVRFIDAFFSRFAAFQKPPWHEKWTEVSLTTRVPGWTRYKAAEDWLQQNRTTPENEIKTDIMRFLSGQAPAAGTQSSPSQ